MRQYDYVEMTTTSIASSGAGAVTLAALTGIPTFTKAFGTGNVDVRYEIEDTVNKTYEVGLGKISSGVLTRTRPQVIWDGSNFSDTNPTAFTFAGAGSPSSGDIRIRMASTSLDKGMTMPGRQTGATGGDDWMDYALSAHGQNNGNGAGFTLTADREYYFPYLNPVAGSLVGVKFELTNNVASSNMKWALFGCGYDGFPGAKITDFVTQDTHTATGYKADTASGSWTPAVKPFLNPGWFYWGFIPSHAIDIRMGSAGNCNFIQTPLSRKDGYGNASLIYKAGSYTTGLPASPGLSNPALVSAGTIGAPWFGMKVAA